MLPREAIDRRCQDFRYSADEYLKLELPKPLCHQSVAKPPLLGRACESPDAANQCTSYTEKGRNDDNYAEPMCTGHFKQRREGRPHKRHHCKENRDRPGYSQGGLSTVRLSLKLDELVAQV